MFGSAFQLPFVRQSAASWALTVIVGLALHNTFLLRIEAADDGFSTTIAPFLKEHCFACHGPEKQEALVRYDRITGFHANERTLWTMVHEKLSAQEMPPADRPQPSAADKQRVLKWIEERQRAGRVGSTRRLNRREVAAALRDVTGLTVDYAFGLPGDGTVAGFDTGAEGLQDAADGVAQWMRITRRAVDGLRFLPNSPPAAATTSPAPRTIFSANLRDTKDAKKLFDEWKSDGANVKGLGSGRPGVGWLIEPRSVGERDELRINIPAPPQNQGVLRMKLVVSAYKPLPGLPNPRLWIEVAGKDIDYRELTQELDQPHELHYQIQLDDLAIESRFINIHLSNKVEIPYAVDGFENDEQSKDKPVPGGTGLYRPKYDRRATPLEKQPAPYIVLQSIEIEPNFVAPWPPAAWKVDVGEVRDDLASAQKLLALWLERAWRRPATNAEREPFLKLFQEVRAAGHAFDESLRTAFQSVLMSGPFRYLAANSHPDPATAQYAIASRLSFWLVGEPPDAELRSLAAARKLREPAVLAAQVDRLLADPRSPAFVRPFVTQWLEMEQPITIAMDHIQRQDFRFARYLKASMKDETIGYVAQMLADNRPAKELLASDWTMMNDILAHHYGYKNVVGGELRRVTLRPDDPRGGGILGHAGLQSMLCWMGDNWVIYRGAWAMRHILDRPPPPPPLEVPELNPADGANRGKTFRQLLKQHQEDARCSICHKHMDPLGFAFQNFDISGRWRDVEHEKYDRAELDGKIAWIGAGATRPVDAAGQLPRGEPFRNFAEFKQVLVKNYQADLVRGLLKNFVVYATGRKPDVDDMAEIATIIKTSQAREFPLRDLIKGIARSKAFLDN